LLSAGAYHSPQILNLSGIGDGDALKKHGITVHKHLPGVGQNLQDHLVYFAIFDTNYKKSLDSAENFPGVIKNLFNYLAFKKGPFSSNVGESGAFVKSSPDQPAIDIQFHFAPNYFVEHGFKNPKTGNGYSIGGKVLNPSRPKQSLKSDAAIADYIRQTGETLYHPTSTCKMGYDDMAVVDNELKVHGIKRLRVVDASIMPTVTRGNTNAPTIMIAEKAADMILA